MKKRRQSKKYKGQAVKLLVLCVLKRVKVSAASIAAVLSGHPVNIFHIGSVQGDEAADRSSAHKAAFVCQLFDLGVGEFDFHVADRGRHTNGTEKVFHGGDSFKRCFFVIAEAVGNIQYVNCQLRETAGPPAFMFVLR